VGRERAMEEALKLLNQTNLSSDDAVEYKSKIDKKKLIKKIKNSASSDFGDTDKLDTIIDLLQKANFSSEDANKIKKRKEYMTALLLVFLGIGFILAGVLIIVTDPEMIKGPTLIYFSPSDGFTLSDLLALIMIGMSSFFFIWSYALLQSK
jgi:hypothetical protein